MIILPITLTVAGAAAILHIWLAVRVSRVRRIRRIAVGDGGDEALLRRMRAHSNYAENMPIFVLLLGLAELAGGDPRLLWGLAIAFVLGRIVHPFGMDRPAPSRLRSIGIVLSMVALAGLAAYAILLAYQAGPGRPEGVQISPGRSAALVR